MLSNGIIVKNVKLKKIEKPRMKMNQFIIARPKKDNSAIDLNSLINKANIPDVNKNKNEVNTSSHLEFLLKQKEERAKFGSFQMIYIKRPNRSFFTKICKYKSKKSKSSKQVKKLNSSLGIFNKKNPDSVGISPVRTAVSNLARQKSKQNVIIQKNKPILNDNCDTKLGSLSTTTCKKNTIVSNASALLNKSNNYLSNIKISNIALYNSKNKKRPLSSFNVIRNEININIRSTKPDNYDNNNTTYNKSSNLQKTKMASTILIDSKDSQGDINNNIFNNKNFINQFKQLKNDFELYGDKNNNLNILKTYQDKKNQTSKKKPDYMMIEDNNEEKRIIRKLDTSKFKGTSYHKIYPRELSPLFNNKYKSIFEDEKQNKYTNLNWCFKCGYKKHFGNEKNCPICKTIKEQNHLKEENLSNKKYYFPLKDKFDKNNYAQKTFKNYENYENNFNNLFNTRDGDENAQSHYINYMSSSPNNNLFDKFKNIKDYKRSKSNIIDDYCFLQEYFD
jgi:rubrerythrin